MYMLHFNNFLQKKYSFSIFLAQIPFIVSKCIKQMTQRLFRISDLYIIENAIKYAKLLSENKCILACFNFMWLYFKVLPWETTNVYVC